MASPGAAASMAWGQAMQGMAGSFGQLAGGAYDSWQSGRARNQPGGAGSYNSR